MLNIKYNIRDTFLIVIVILSGLFLKPTYSYAQSSSLSISPPLVQIELDPPGSLETPIHIKNNASDPVDLQILFKPFTASGENGQIQFLKDTSVFPGPNTKIRDHIAIRDHGKTITSLTLSPQEEKDLDLYVGLPAKEPHADYYFSVVFLPQHDQEAPDKDENGSSLTAGIGLNLLLSVGPSDEAKGVIDSFSSPSYVQSGPVPFSVRIRNMGSRYFSPTGTISITNMFGQKIAKIPLLSLNVLPGTVRAFIGENDFKEALKKENQEEKNDQNLSNQTPPVNPQVIWPEKFLIGPYTATLQVKLNDKSPTIMRQIRFFAFPVQGLIGVFIIGIMLYLIRQRMRKRMQEDA